MKLLENDFSGFLINEDGKVLPDGDLLPISASSSFMKQPFSEVIDENLLQKISKLTKKYELIETENNDYPLISVTKIIKDDEPYFRVIPINSYLDEKSRNMTRNVFAEFEKDKSDAKVFINLKYELEEIFKELRKYRQFKYKNTLLYAPINVIVEFSYSSIQYLIVAMIHLLTEVGFDKKVSVDLRKEGSIRAKASILVPFIKTIHDVEKSFPSAVASSELLMSITQNEDVGLSVIRHLNELHLNAKIAVADRRKAPVKAETAKDRERRAKIIELFFGES